MYDNKKNNLKNSKIKMHYKFDENFKNVENTLFFAGLFLGKWRKCKKSPLVSWLHNIMIKNN